jgi:nucleotide-binding universal stress UspA family protein
MIQALVEQERDNVRNAEDHFRSKTAPSGVDVVWVSDADYPDHALEVSAAGADLIVASLHRGPESSTASAANLVLGVGLPVLAIPTDLPAIQTKKIVIAWKNTREARRAVSDALPLLKRAEQVTILHTSKPDEVGIGVDDLMGRLKRHGVNAVAETVKPGADAAETIIRFAERGLFDMIVCGAYGHSRAAEWVMGGVTAGLVERSTLPVLFSH